MSTGIRLNENAICDTCGRFGAYEFDGRRLCPECYEARGSCCREFGDDDLWKKCDASSRTAGDESKSREIPSDV